MSNGFSFQDTLSILETKKNKQLFSVIRRRLEQGEQLSELMIQYCPDDYRKWYEGFALYMPFLESMTMTITICTQQEAQKKQLVRGILYPILLMTGMAAGIRAFASFVLPVMISLLSGFGMEYAGLDRLRMILSAGSLLFFLLCFTVICTGLYAVQKKRITAIYKAAAKAFPDSFFVKYASAEFTRFFLECTRVNVSTRQTLEILSTLKQKPLTAFIASELDRSLLSGDSMEEAVCSPYVEAALTRFLQIAIYSSDCIHMLEGYLQMTQERTERSIRRFTAAVQVVSYSCIGAVIVLVYRIMLLPMTMISSL